MSKEMSYLILDLGQTDRVISVLWPGTEVATLTFPDSILVRSTLGLGIEVIGVGENSRDSKYKLINQKTLRALRKVLNSIGYIEIPFSFPAANEQILRESVQGYIKEAVVSGKPLPEKGVKETLLLLRYEDIDYICRKETAAICVSAAFWEEYYHKHYDKENEITKIPAHHETWQSAVKALATAKQSGDFYMEAVKQGISAIAKDKTLLAKLEAPQLERALRTAIYARKENIANYYVNEGVKIRNPHMKVEAIREAKERGYSNVVSKLEDT